MRPDMNTENPKTNRPGVSVLKGYLKGLCGSTGTKRGSCGILP